MRIKKKSYLVLCLTCMVLSLAFFFVYQTELRLKHPIVRLTEVMDQIPAGVPVSEDTLAQLNAVTTEFRLNPINYVRIFDCRVESGVAPMVFSFGEKLPLEADLASWMSTDQEWRIDTTSALPVVTLWTVLRNAGYCSLFASIAFLVVFLVRKLSKNSI